MAGAETLEGFAVGWLDRREGDGYRGIAKDRNRWSMHLAPALFATWALKSITRADIITWIDEMKGKHAAPGKGHGKRPKRKLSRSVIQSSLNLLRVCLADALERGKIPENPADGVRIRMNVHKTEESWTYLTLKEQQSLFADDTIPEAERLIMQFAIGTGLRMGELWNLELRDVHAGKDEPNPRVVVRFGAPNLPPKNGKIREVPLFGLGLDAARRWLGLLPSHLTSAYGKSYKNEHRLMFPASRGGRRDTKPTGGVERDKRGVYVRRFELWMRKHCGRDVRWHDLRHTCASALISDMWGRRWSLEEVCALLGHQDIKTTQRYAHLAPTALQSAALATASGSEAIRPRIGPPAPEPPSVASVSIENHWAPPARIGLATFGLGKHQNPEALLGVKPSCGPIVALSRRLVEAIAGLGGGDPYALRQLIAAAEEAAGVLAGLPATSDGRATLLAQLGASAGELAAQGDVEGARVAIEAMQRLLGSCDAAAAPVVDLNRERKRRR